MKRMSSSSMQVPSTLSPWFLASIALVALIAVALAVALVVTSGIGPHLALVAQSAAHSLLANGGGPRWPCPGGVPYC
jgi:hypothetical protein